MKITIIGGSGRIGSQLARRLRDLGHTVVAASPSTGVNSLTGEGLDEALYGAQVVVDVANSPSFEDDAVLAFFETSTRILLLADAKAGVQHHIALSIVGADRVPESGYLRAKVAQERIIAADGVPYTIVRATQFFEFLGAIAQSSAVGDSIYLTPAQVQNIAAADVVSSLTEICLGEPVKGVIEVAGPETFSLAELVQRYLVAAGDPRKVVADWSARYFGAVLTDESLTPGPNAWLGSTRFEDWLKQSSSHV